MTQDEMKDKIKKALTKIEKDAFTQIEACNLEEGGIDEAAKIKRFIDQLCNIEAACHKALLEHDNKMEALYAEARSRGNRFREVFGDIRFEIPYDLKRLTEALNTLNATSIEGLESLATILEGIKDKKQGKP